MLGSAWRPPSDEPGLQLVSDEAYALLQRDADAVRDRRVAAVLTGVAGAVLLLVGGRRPADD